MKTLNKELLLEILDYKNGQLFWKKKIADKVNVGDLVGDSLDDQGYKGIHLFGKRYRQHRIIFMMHYGYFPKRVDHKDTNKTNNVIENLRPSTQAQNRHNSKVRSDNKLGIKGVRFNGFSYYARVNKTTFGPFKNLELAELVAQEARLKFHKDFAYKDDL